MKRDLSFVYTIPEIFLFRHENFSGLVSEETTQKWNKSCTASLHSRSSLVPGSGTEIRRRQGHPMCDNLLCSPRYRNHAEICSFLTDFMPSYPKKKTSKFFDNYRTTERILSFQSHPPIKARSYNRVDQT